MCKKEERNNQDSLAGYLKEVPNKPEIIISREIKPTALKASLSS